MTTKIALVTGANRGIGKEIARQLGQLGHTVLVGARKPGGTTAAELAAEGIDAREVRLDVLDQVSIEAAAKEIETSHGRLDVLVNNAAIIPPGDNGVPEIDTAVLRQAFETNVIGLVAVTQAMLPLLRQAEQARIVNLSSELATMTSVGDPDSPMSQMRMLGYNSSKAAVNMVTVMLANDLRDTGIAVNAADPGNCQTEMGGWDAPRTPAQGAAVAVHLATLPAKAPTGRLYAESGQLAW
ncbi:SDR family NAD(P)-dependent oxidoreductase [Kribbella deserti]|uniref:SDR family NAD(P)-dependent oxidoreductase n=1 Tax=Kribbella deserti TaxID=1926257 RepID=A0ABV6QGW4_9ACTN